MIPHLFWSNRIWLFGFGVRIRAWVKNNLDAVLFAYALFINSLYQRDPYQCHHHTEGQGANRHSRLDCLLLPDNQQRANHQAQSPTPKDNMRAPFGPLIATRIDRVDDQDRGIG